MAEQPFDLKWLEKEVDDDYKPGNLAGKLDGLTDGEYLFEIAAAKVKLLTDKGMLIVEMDLEVLTPGKHQGGKFQHALFIKDKDSAARAGKDLMTLGVDCDLWTKENKRPFSQEIMKVHRVLKGIRFQGKKVKNDKYHNLYINKREPGDGKPEILGPEQLDTPDPADPFDGQ